MYAQAAPAKNYARKLIVTSYDPAQPEGSNGKFELFTVPAVNGDLELLESYTGFGKIVDVSFRERQ